MTEIVDEFRKLEQRLEGKLLGRHPRITRGCRIPISPLTPNGDAAASGVAQNQRLGPSDTASFKNGETLAFQRVEWMSNFCPSQRLVGNLGSSR
jgi:hypothetical protein